MELSFVISALRRRFWVVTVLALLGSLPGLLSDPPTSTEYRSTAALSVQPPTRATVNLFSTDPDRYVVTQLSVLESQELAEEVAAAVDERFNDPISVAALRTLVEIEQEPQTDIVHITTTIDSAEKAQFISQSYAELYVQGLATTDEDEVQRADLEQQIQTLENQLDALDQRLEERMRDFLPSGNEVNPAPIPSPDVVDPSAVSQRQLIIAQLTQLQSQLADLEAQSRVRVNTEIIASAPLPLEPLPPGRNYLLAGGLLGGAALGVVLALIWARFSAKVLDDTSAGELLGAPIVSEFPRYGKLARSPLEAFQSLPRSAVPTIDQLCVRAEALAKIGQPLTVLVTGTMRSAGTTTLSLAMAERFAAGGASVVLVDADVRDPRVTALFNATSDGGVPTVIANGGALIDERGRSALTRTMDPAVSVLGLGPNRGSAALRRDTVPVVLEASRRKAEIVVVDGGPVLDLASTLQFAALADAVVLAVPMARQKADALADMGRQLESMRPKLLPVVTAPSRRAARGEVVGSDGAIAMPGISSGTGGGRSGSGGGWPSATQQPARSAAPTDGRTAAPAAAPGMPSSAGSAAPLFPSTPPGSSGGSGSAADQTVTIPDPGAGSRPPTSS